MYFFTADEHYGHAKIIDYYKRPFANVEVMNEILISRFNEHVGRNDITVHVGDFGWFKNREEAEKVFRRLNGNHIFVKGSHDRWLPDNHRMMWRKHLEGQFVVCCHYAMRTWERAYHGSWDLYGHSHGTLPPIGKQWDVGVDNNNFAPLSFDQLKVIMETRKIFHCPEHDQLQIQEEKIATAGVGIHRCSQCGHFLMSEYNCGGYEGSTWDIRCPKGCRLTDAEKCVDPTECLHPSDE